jgi:hypothetical protein
MDKNMTIDRLLLLVSHTKVEAPAVRHMILCFFAVSPRFSNLMSYNMEGPICGHVFIHNFYNVTILNNSSCVFRSVRF